MKDKLIQSNKNTNEISTEFKVKTSHSINNVKPLRNILNPLKSE